MIQDLKTHDKSPEYSIQGFCHLHFNGYLITSFLLTQNRHTMQSQSL